MRTLSLVFTAGLASLFLALPARAQDDAAEPADAEGSKAEAPKEATTQAASPEAQASASGEVSAHATTAAKPAIAMEGAAEGGAESAPVSAPVTSSSPSQRGADTADTSWKMEYHGYLRAPMRLGMGKRDNPLDGQSGTTLHYPVIPDDQYLSWQSTAHNKKDWAEMFFTIGNELASGTLALQGFNFTDAAWTDPTSNFGISQGYVTLTPDLGYENVRLSVKAGSFWARYGMAGKWDAGEYDTYLFGRLHHMGELIHVEYDIDDANTLWFEHGVGVKRPDPSQFNNAKFTMVHHAHVGFNAGAGMQFSAHYLHSWAQEEDRIVKPYNSVSTPPALADPYNPVNYPSSLQNQPDGKLWVAGIDARFELGAFGYLYAGYSHIGAEDSLSVGPAIEVLHAFGGGAFQLGVADNYFGPSCQGAPANVTAAGPQALDVITSPPNAQPYGQEFGCSLGTGKVDSVLAQYEFSLTNFLQQIEGGQKFWGDGQDAKITLYGMLNKVTSDVPGYDGNTKIKYGTDLQFGILPWLTFATRYDRVQPHSDFPEQSFSIISPRLVFKSQWLTREQISLQYSRYLYNQRECEGVTPAFNTAGGGSNPFTVAQLNCVQPPPAPGSAESFGSYWLKQEEGLRGAPTTRPDVNVIKIEASMWW